MNVCRSSSKLCGDMFIKKHTFVCFLKLRKHCQKFLQIKEKITYLFFGMDALKNTSEQVYRISAINNDALMWMNKIS